jgi:hypothetical protein
VEAMIHKHVRLHDEAVQKTVLRLLTSSILETTL